MDITIRKTTPLQHKTGLLAIGVFEKGLSAPLCKDLDNKLGGLLRKAQRNGEFNGKDGEEIIFQPAGHLPAERILLLGLGPRKQASLETLRQAAGKATRQAIKSRVTKAAFAMPYSDVRNCAIDTCIGAVSEGALLSIYSYDRFLNEETRDRHKTPQAITLVIDNSKDKRACELAVDKAHKLSRAVTLTRDLVNSPGNIKSPTFLAEQAREAAEQSKLTCKIINRQDLAEEGFGALLGVAQGSEREPHLIILEHKGGKTGEAPVALVGKGVVFDAGGLSLKPAAKMDEMKMDMAGGATVIGAMLAASLLDLPSNLVGLVPTVENLPSGTAYRPGDILTSLSGQTIEVLNTDAEGRLILADALTYAKRYEPRLVVDLATLTGACVVALGHHATAVLGNDQKLIDSLLKAGEASGERLWQLPLWETYDQLIKSNVADVKNVGGPTAGTITAAAFLKKFAGDFRWAHLDIAGTAWRDQDQPYTPKGGTGVGVRMLIEFLTKSASNI